MQTWFNQGLVGRILQFSVSKRNNHYGTLKDKCKNTFPKWIRKRKLLFHSSIQIRPVQDQYSTKLGSTQDQYQNHILGRLRTNIKTIFKLNLGPIYNQLRTAWCHSREHVRLYAIYSVVPLSRQMFNNACYQTSITAVCFIKETTPSYFVCRDNLGPMDKESQIPKLYLSITGMLPHPRANLFIMLF